MSKGREKHPIHFSLVDEPTFGGIPRLQFFMEVGFCLLILNIFRFSLISLVLLLAVYFGVHQALKSAYKEDSMQIELWLMALIDSQHYYPSAPDINTKSSKDKHSIPTNL